MLVALILVRWLFIASVIAMTAAIVPGVEVSGGFLGLLGVAALFGIVNAIIGPFVRLLSLPLTLITFGLFALVINGALLALTAGLSSNLEVGGFLPAVIGAFVISLISALAQFMLHGRSVQPA